MKGIKGLCVIALLALGCAEDERGGAIADESLWSGVPTHEGPPKTAVTETERLIADLEERVAALAERRDRLAAAARRADHRAALERLDSVGERVVKLRNRVDAVAALPREQLLDAVDGGVEAEMASIARALDDVEARLAGRASGAGGAR